MPSSPPTACPCGGRRQRGQPCDRCGRGKRDERPADVKHFNNVAYGRKWKAFRLSYLKVNPLCQDCKAEDIVRPATEVHHLAKVKDDPSRQYEHDNLMPLCKRHHSARTAIGQ